MSYNQVDRILYDTETFSLSNRGLPLIFNKKSFLLWTHTGPDYYIEICGYDEGSVYTGNVSKFDANYYGNGLLIAQSTGLDTYEHTISECGIEGSGAQVALNHVMDQIDEQVSKLKFLLKLI